MNKIICLKCGKECPSVYERYELFFIIPHPFYVPNKYYLCMEHKNERFRFEDVYNPDGTLIKEIEEKLYGKDGSTKFIHPTRFTEGCRVLMLIDRGETNANKGSKRKGSEKIHKAI